MDGSVFFSAVDASGEQLWRSDGTSAGTFQVSQFSSLRVPDGENSIEDLTVDNGTLFFTADAGSGRQLYAYNPLTAIIPDVSPDPRGSPVDSMTIGFSEPAYGLSLSDLSFTLNGGPNFLTGADL